MSSIVGRAYARSSFAGKHAILPYGLDQPAPRLSRWRGGILYAGSSGLGLRETAATRVSPPAMVRIGTIKDVLQFERGLQALNLRLPCDRDLALGADSALRRPLVKGPFRIGNRIAVQPMEGWDGTGDGNPSENTVRRWRRFGQTGAKLVWGGEAVAVNYNGRANPNQLVAAAHTEAGLARLRSALLEEHERTTGSDQDLVIGLQLTHSGRYSRPSDHHRPEPKILYHHPFLDRRLQLPADYPLLTDSEIEVIIKDFHTAAAIAWKLGFQFVDIKHCHGYLGHEFLSARTREGRYGGTFENRTRFLREVVEGIRSRTPGLQIGVRLSAFDTLPFRPDPQLREASSKRSQARGVPEPAEAWLPYCWGFGVNRTNPIDSDLEEPLRFLALLQELGIFLVNITAGSPYYNPHIQRPALYPPSDGYFPPEDPLQGVARHMEITRQLKHKFPDLILVGSAYSYLQDFLPYVAQAAIREQWVDCVGLGRMVLAYPELLWHASGGLPIDRKRICRTFSDCTTAPRNGLPSGCYPLDNHYKNSPQAEQLRVVKKG